MPRNGLELDTKGINAKLDRLKRAMPAVQGAAIFSVAQEVMAESKRLVPVDTGNLRATGTVASPVTEAGTTSVRLGYGGTAIQYGVRVHEDLTAHHPGGGQAKFLEIPLANGRSIRARILARVKQGMEAANG